MISGARYEVHLDYNLTRHNVILQKNFIRDHVDNGSVTAKVEIL